MAPVILDDPVTGTRIVVRRRSEETQGRVVVVEMLLQPWGRPFAPHVHPRQDETIDVLHGRVAFRLGRAETVGGPGHRVRIPAGMPHEFHNRGDDVAHVVCELRPAPELESLLEAVFGRANTHFETTRAAFPPAAVQRAALWLGAAVGRLLRSGG